MFLRIFNDTGVHGKKKKLPVTIRLLPGNSPLRNPSRRYRFFENYYRDPGLVAKRADPGTWTRGRIEKARNDDVPSRATYVGKYVTGRAGDPVARGNGSPKTSDQFSPSNCADAGVSPVRCNRTVDPHFPSPNSFVFNFNFLCKFIFPPPRSNIIKTASEKPELRIGSYSRGLEKNLNYFVRSNLP